MPQDNLGWQSVYMAMAGTPGSVTEPVDYTEIWNDKGTGSRMDGAVWRPSAPDGYTAVGDLWNRDYGKPDTKSMFVVKKECVVQCQQTPQLIYSGASRDAMHVTNMHLACTYCNTDKGSWSKRDVSVYSVGVGALGTPSPDNIGVCRAQPNYSPVDRNAAWNLCLKRECARTSAFLCIVVVQLLLNACMVHSSAQGL